MLTTASLCDVTVVSAGCTEFPNPPKDELRHKHRRWYRRTLFARQESDADSDEQGDDEPGDPEAESAPLQEKIFDDEFDGAGFVDAAKVLHDAFMTAMNGSDHP